MRNIILDCGSLREEISKVLERKSVILIYEDNGLKAIDGNQVGIVYCDENMSTNRGSEKENIKDLIMKYKKFNNIV